MTSRISKLVLAAVLASTLPAAAAARECDHVAGDFRDPGDRYERGDRRDDRVAPIPLRPAPAPVLRFREAAFRERELREIRAELQALDAERAELHARFGWNPGKLRRYDRWYIERRAELEWRWSALQRVAWR
ncbi:MAG TPA: hypothetical protein VF894_06105 [Anaeromyxobacter sp.]